MPTGYTQAIEKGCSFEDYVWGCARGMGACVMMRDAAWDDPIPEKFEPNTYYQERLAEEERKLAEIDRLTDNEIVDQMTAVNAEIRARNEDYRIGHEDLKLKYQAMREKVMAWNPPTPDHHGLKKFMLEQIDLCLDTGEPYQWPETEIVTPDEWRKNAVANAMKGIARASDEWNKEQERTSGRNAWLKQLRESVPQPNPTKG